MITIFSVPKPFSEEHIKKIQLNAINSWKKLGCNIMLLGDEAGVSDIAKKLGLQHFPDVKKNIQGTPLLDSAFRTAIQNSGDEILVYVNTDIILQEDFTKAIYKVMEKFGAKQFLLIGQRTDCDIDKAIDLCNSGDADYLNGKAKNGKLHGPTGIDYFVFRKNAWREIQIPPFSIGRFLWDNWILFRLKKMGAALVDMTPSVTAVHQNHTYGHIKKFDDYDTNEEVLANKALFGKQDFIFNIDDSDKIWAEGELRPRKLQNAYGLYRAILKLSCLYPTLAFLGKMANIIVKSIIFLKNDKAKYISDRSG